MSRRTPFQQFIDTLVERYGTAEKVAAMIPMSASAFSRGVKSGSLGEERLLLLAEAVGESPIRVLRIAGKDSVADAIERLFGAPRPPLSREDRVLLALDLDTKQHLVRVVHNLSK